jgi:hypothetical protein
MLSSVCDARLAGVRWWQERAFGGYYVQEGDQKKLLGASCEEVQADKTDQKSLIQIEPLVCGRCAVDRGRERAKVIAAEAALR